MKQLISFALASLALVCSVAGADEKPIVQFRGGDRIAFVGNEFFEREADRCYIETELTTRFPDKNLTFRNLGYSGDTVRADARNLCSGWAVFGPADQGFDRLKNLIEHIKPTMIFVAYGMNESFEGPKGLDPFVNGLGRMLDMLSANSASGVRIVLVSPIRHEDLGRPLPDPREHNQNLVLYIDAMAKIASERGYSFINLFEAMGDGAGSKIGRPLTSNGIHLTPYGYWRAANAIEQALGYTPRVWSVELPAFPSNGSPKVEGATVESFQMEGGLGNEYSLKCRIKSADLPIAPSPQDAPDPLARPAATLPGEQRLFRVVGLPMGRRYVLTCDGQEIAVANGKEWAAGVQVQTGPDMDQEESLRKTIVAKNFDFFNFWRPDNDTYIFGYRKHEQGRNAVEIPRFEPLVAAKEAQIAKLRVPAPHTYTLSPEKRG